MFAKRKKESDMNILRGIPIAASLENYAARLRKMDQDLEAAQLEARAKAIRAKHAKENP